MSEKYELDIDATYRGRPVVIVSRVYVDGQWLYGLRYKKSGKIVDYIPGRFLGLAT